MKKIVIFLLLLIPIKINADYSITNYRIDMTILENGNVDVIETFKMSGEFNGYEKFVDYKNIYNGYHGSKLSSVEDISLYDAKGIKLHEIRSVDYSDTLDINDITINSNLFERVNEALKGQYGVYTMTKTENGILYKIFNPSKFNKDFYINYEIDNLVITHEDISEVSIKLLDKIDYQIDNLEIYIHIPNNQTLLKSWIHNDANSNIEYIDIETIKITAKNLSVTSPFDFRVVFDRNVIKDVTKESNQIVLDKIINIENQLNFGDEFDYEYELIKEKAYNLILLASKTKKMSDYNDALIFVNNLKDDEFKTDLLLELMNIKTRIERNYIFSKVLFTSFMGIWVIGLLILLYQTYKKYYSNESIYDSNINIDDNYLPSTIGYLNRRKVTKDDLVSCVLNLIYKGNITYKKTRKDYKLMKTSVDNLTKSEERIFKLLFFDKKEITLSGIVKMVKNNYEQFITEYSNWINISTDEAVCENLFEDVFKLKIFGVVYSIIGFFIAVFLIGLPTYVSPFIVIFISFVSVIYFMLFYKRTLKGEEQYFKWKLIKKSINSLNINLIDKYVVYGQTLNCINKLKKYNTNEYYRNMIDLNDCINTCINSVIDIAYSTRKNFNT